MKQFNCNRIEISWCPGCGNFQILQSLKKAFHELELDNKEIALISGIGQAAKTPHYINVNGFNGLHGRSVPVATGVKLANPHLTVLAEGGDGDMYSEGGNHLLHAMRRNINITVIVHNNMIYGLTKGQASPTSEYGFVTKLQHEGSRSEPFNPISFAVSQNAGFVARSFSKDIEFTKEILKKAIEYKGFSIVDILQPCVTFNKINTYKWFEDHSYYLDEKYDPENRIQAFEKSIEKDNFALGLIYKGSNKNSFEENINLYTENSEALFSRKVDLKKLSDIIN